MAGGHIGFSMEEANLCDPSSLDRLLPEVLAVAQEFGQGTPIPVVAAGGVFDGADIARLLGLGASGVQMGTRFVCTEECDSSIEFKKQYLSAQPKDIVVLKSPVGMPLRVVRNAFVEAILAGAKTNFECKYHCLATCNPASTPYCIAKALVNAQKGLLNLGFAPCGSNAPRIKGIVSVKRLIDELVAQAEALLPPPLAASPA
jgi:nitronate monooxygenase